MKKIYCVVVTDDYSRFTWVFVLATKDDTNGILKSFITRIENLVDHKVKVIRCDDGTEFKNREMNQFCKIKDHLGKFNGKADEGFFIGYSLNSKAFRVFNSRTMIVEDNFHIRFSENIPNVAGTQSNSFVGIKASDNADPKSSQDDGLKPSNDDGKKVHEDPRKENKCNDQEKEDTISSTVNACQNWTKLRANGKRGKVQGQQKVKPDKVKATKSKKTKEMKIEGLNV
nr:putative ribonuclease H-like domain-containing protein [Tanacetum cinerariifolium]